MIIMSDEEKFNLLNKQLDNVRDSTITEITNDKQLLIDKIKLNIIGLQEKRMRELKHITCSSHLYSRTEIPYQGTVLSENEGIWTDLNKSVEYEAILSSILDLLITTTGKKSKFMSV